MHGAYLFIGGPADGCMIAVPQESNGPRATFFVEEPPPLRFTDNPEFSLTRNMHEYRAKQLRDQDGRDHFVFVHSDLIEVAVHGDPIEIDALIKGYRKGGA